MLVAVFGDVHAHAEALEAVLAAAERDGADELWSLGDMIGAGPDPDRVVAATRAHCTVALMGNHDYGATGGVALERFGDPAAANARSIVLAQERLGDDELAWMRTRRPAARRHGVQCWHGGPRNPVWEYVTPATATGCLEAQRADIGLVGHTHVPAAFRQAPRRARRVAIEPGVPLDVGAGRWLLNPGAVGAPVPPRRGWWDGLDAEAALGAFWLLLDLDGRTATWRRAPYDPAPARRRARELGLDDTEAPRISGSRRD
jgi:predicted phosphodiesterase